MARPTDEISPQILFFFRLTEVVLVSSLLFPCNVPLMSCSGGSRPTGDLRCASPRYKSVRGMSFLFRIWNGSSSMISMLYNEWTGRRVVSIEREA